MRLLPITIFALIFMFGFRVYHVAMDAKHYREGDSFIVSSLNAEEAAEVKKAADAAKSASEEKPKEDVKADTESQKPVDVGGAETTDAASTTEGKDSAPAAEPVPSVNAPAEDAPKREFSDVEVDLLQSLSQRRKELEEREKEFELRENVLKATELRINSKIDEMKDLKVKLEEILVQYNQKDQENIKSLVKIYETMKPKEAARVFEELEMPVLLQVVDKMSQRKLAAVLAAMDPKKAKAVTEELAKKRQLPDINDQATAN